MEDVTLVAKIDHETTLYVSPVHGQTYLEHIESDNLGGPSGYFIARERRQQYEILAKAANLDAARELFGLLTAGRRAPA